MTAATSAQLHQAHTCIASLTYHANERAYSELVEINSEHEDRLAHKKGTRRIALDDSSGLDG